MTRCGSIPHTLVQTWNFDGGKTGAQTTDADLNQVCVLIASSILVIEGQSLISSVLLDRFQPVRPVANFHFQITLR